MDYLVVGMIQFLEEKGGEGFALLMKEDAEREACEGKHLENL